MYFLVSVIVVIEFIVVEEFRGAGILEVVVFVELIFIAVFFIVYIAFVLVFVSFRVWFVFVFS